MDRRTLLAVLLSISIYYVWLLLRGPSLGTEAPDPTAPAPTEVAATPAAPPARTVPVPVDRPTRLVPFEACGAEGRWTSLGGALQDLTLQDHREPYDVRPIWSWVLGLVTGTSETPWKPWGEEPGPARLLTADALALSAGTGALTSPPVPTEVVQEPTGVVFRGVTADGVEVVQRTRPVDGAPCTLQVEVTWTNGGSTPAGPLWIGVHDRLPEAGGGMLARYRSVEQPVLMVDGDVVHADLGDIDDAGAQGVPHDGPVAWFGLADRYFGFLVLPSDGSGRAVTSRRESADGPLYGEHYVEPVPSLAPGASHTANYRVYVGPLELGALRAVDEALTEIVDFGWFAFFAHPLLWLLKLFHAGVQNWGVAIMLLTLLVKMIFFPLTQSAFKSSQAMAALQPHLQELREKYQDNQEELNRRMMELFQKHGVNPLGGCLPMLIQFPVWIALYNVLLSSVELYHTEFLWLKDLSSADPTGILPAVVVLLMIVQQSFTPMGNMDPVQQRVMKLMPILFGVFFFAFPSGLVVYIFVNMVLSILQQWLIKRTYVSPAVAA